MNFQIIEKVTFYTKCVSTNDSFSNLDLLLWQMYMYVIIALSLEYFGVYKLSH